MVKGAVPAPCPGADVVCQLAHFRRFQRFRKPYDNVACRKQRRAGIRRFTGCRYTPYTHVMTNETAPKRRRIGPSDARRHSIRVQVNDAERERLAALSERYGVAVATICHDACIAGLGAVVERMRRAARASAREAGK